MAYFRANVIPRDILALSTISSASGSIATFDTDMSGPFYSLKTDINPVQDLHGYSKPWSGGGGKNKLNYDAWKTVSTYNGTAVWENNGVTLTATTNDCYTLSNTDMRVPISEGETITLSWEETANVNGAIYIFPNGTTSGMVYTQNASNKKLSYTATSGVTFVTWQFGVQTAGVTAYYKNIQIEKGSQATSWEPYENICPISGFSALNVTLADGDMQTVDTATVNFGQTVYGGVADVTGGNTTSKYERIKISDMTWTASGDFFYSSLPLKKVGNTTFLCECLRVVDVASVSAMVNGDIKGHPSNTNMYIKNTDWASATDLYNAIGNYYIVYELATPTEISTTPENLTALSGQNNVYGDTNGDTTVEFIETIGNKLS